LPRVYFVNWSQIKWVSCSCIYYVCSVYKYRNILFI